MTPWSHPFSERASVFRFVTADPALEALVTPDTGSQAFELYLAVITTKRSGPCAARPVPWKDDRRWKEEAPKGAPQRCSNLAATLNVRGT